MNRGSRLAAALLFGLIVAVALFLPSGGDAEPRAESIVSTEPDGWRAAYLLLGRLGFDVDEWRRPPDVLPPGEVVLFLPRVPPPLVPPDLVVAEHGDVDDVDDGADGAAGAEAGSGPGEVGPARRRRGRGDDPLERSRLRALDGYRRFVEAGGVLVVADGAAEREMLRELGIEEIARLLFDDASRVAEARGVGGTFELSGWRGRGGPAADVPAGGAVEALLEDEDGRALAWRVRVGHGEVAWLSTDRFLRNDRIADAGHARLLVRLVEELAPDLPVRFDEYAAGRWSPGTFTDLLTGAALGPATLQLVLLALLATWLAAWPADFPRDPPPLERLSPLARAEALASLCVRARRESLLGAWLREGVWGRIVDAMRLPREGLVPEARGLERLETLLAARGLPEPARARLRTAFAAEAVEDREQLAELAARLRAVEADVAALDGAAPVPGDERRRDAGAATAP